MFNLSKEELKTLKPLSTPHKIQDFLDSLPYNYEKEEETCNSPRVALRNNKAHCIEGAYIAATALWVHGYEPLLLDLKSEKMDDDHVVTLYKKNGYWGAISKTNHAVLRFRDPIYKTVRELALSYFHEYFMLSTGKKTLAGYSKPFSLKRYKEKWITEEEGLWQIAADLDDSKHFPFVPKPNKRFIRDATPFERTAIQTTEWSKENPLT